MKELKYFKAGGIPAITAAIAGICKTEWTFIEKGAQIDEVSGVMSKNRFDISPVKKPDGSRIYFCKTNNWQISLTTSLIKFIIISKSLFFSTLLVFLVIYSFLLTSIIMPITFVSSLWYLVGINVPEYGL
jgi:hypothetical protein